MMSFSIRIAQFITARSCTLPLRLNLTFSNTSPTIVLMPCMPTSQALWQLNLSLATIPVPTENKSEFLGKENAAATIYTSWCNRCFLEQLVHLSGLDADVRTEMKHVLPKRHYHSSPNLWPCIRPSGIFRFFIRNCSMNCEETFSKNVRIFIGRHHYLPVQHILEV